MIDKIELSYFRQERQVREGIHIIIYRRFLNPRFLCPPHSHRTQTASKQQKLSRNFIRQLQSVRMGTIDDQIKDAREQRSRAHRTNTDPNAADISDNKGGIQFGTSVAYDDAYHADSGDFVSELPTLDEERRMMGDDDGGARRRAEMEDSGRIGSHPSTLAGMKVCCYSTFTTD